MLTKQEVEISSELINEIQEEFGFKKDFDLAKELQDLHFFIQDNQRCIKQVPRKSVQKEQLKQLMMNARALLNLLDNTILVILEKFNDVHETVYSENNFLDVQTTAECVNNELRKLDAIRESTKGLIGNECNKAFVDAIQPLLACGTYLSLTTKIMLNHALPLDSILKIKGDFVTSMKHVLKMIIDTCVSVIQSKEQFKKLKKDLQDLLDLLDNAFPSILKKFNHAHENVCSKNSFLDVPIEKLHCELLKLNEIHGSITNMIEYEWNKQFIGTMQPLLDCVAQLSITTKRILNHALPLDSTLKVNDEFMASLKNILKMAIEACENLGKDNRRPFNALARNFLLKLTSIYERGTGNELIVYFDPNASDKYSGKFFYFLKKIAPLYASPALLFLKNPAAIGQTARDALKYLKKLRKEASLQL